MKSVKKLGAGLLFLSLALAKATAADAGMTTIPLNEAINAALTNNFSFRIAALDPEIARQNVIVAEAPFDPEIFASGQVSQSEQNRTFTQTTGTSSDVRSWRAGVQQRFAYGTSVTAQTNLDRQDSNAGVNTTSNLSQSADFSLSVRQPLLNGFGKEANLARIESANAGYAASIQSFRNTILDVLAETERAYWNVSRLQEQLSLNESSLKVAETLLEEAVERERVGLATRVDVLQAQAARAQRYEEIIETRRVLGDALDLLYERMGTFPEGMEVLDEPSVRVAKLVNPGEATPDIRQIWDEALANDPRLQQQEAIIAQQESERAAARNGVNPDLDLVFSGGYNGLDEREAEIAYENALARDGHSWAVGIEFSMPWRMRGEKAVLLNAEKNLEQAELRYIELKQSLYRAVRSALRDFQATRQSMEASQITVRLQEATFEREMGKYEEGVSVFRDVLEVQRDLDLAQARLIVAKYNQISAEIDIALLTGRLFSRHGLSESDFLPEK